MGNGITKLPENAINGAYTIALNASRLNPTTKSVEEKKQIDLLELLSILKETVLAVNGNEPTALMSREDLLIESRKYLFPDLNPKDPDYVDKALTNFWSSLTPTEINTTDFYSFMTDCYFFTKQIEDMPEILKLPNGKTFDPLNPPKDTVDTRTVALEIIYRNYFYVKFMIEKFELVLKGSDKGKTQDNIFTYFRTQGRAFNHPNTDAIVALVTDYTSQPPVGKTYSDIYNKIYYPLNLNNTKPLVELLLAFSDRLGDADTFIAKIKLLSEKPTTQALIDNLATFKAINAESDIKLPYNQLGLITLINSYTATMQNNITVTKDRDAALYLMGIWNNVPELLSTPALREKGKELVSTYNQLVMGVAGTTIQKTEKTSDYQLKGSTDGAAQIAIERNNDSIVQANIAVLKECIREGNYILDIASLYKPPLESSPAMAINTALSSLIKLENEAAVAAANAGDQANAYIHYQNIAAYLADGTLGTKGPFTAKVKETFAKQMAEVAAKLEEFKKTMLTMRDVLAKGDESLADKLTVLGDNKDYISLYEKWFGADMSAIGKKLIDSINSDEQIHTLLDKGLYGTFRNLPQSTIIDKADKTKPAVNSIEEAFTACVKKIILPLISNKDFSALTTMQLSIIKARNSFSAGNYAEIITNLNFVLTNSPDAAPTKKIIPPIVVEKSVGVPTSTTREAASSSLILDLNGHTDDLGTLTVGALTGPINPGDSTAPGSPIYDAISNTTQGAQLTNSGGQLVGFVYNGTLYIVDPDTGNVVGPADPASYTLVNGVLTLKGGLNADNTLTLTSGTTTVNVAILGDLQLLAITPVGSTTTSVASDGTTVLTLVGTTQVMFGNTEITIAADGTITLTPAQIASMIYDGTVLTISGPNGEATLTVEEIFGKDNVAWGDPTKLKIKMQANGPYNILMNEFAPSFTYSVTGNAAATTTIDSNGTILTFAPRIVTSGSAQVHTLADGSQIIYGHGTITVTSTTPGATGTATNTQEIVLPDYPPILKEIGQLLPNMATLSFYRYKYNALPEGLDAYDYVRNTMNIDGIRIPFAMKQVIPGTMPANKEVTGYMLLKDPAVVKAYTFLKGSNASFSENQYLKLYILAQFSKAYDKLAFDAVLPIEIRATLAKTIKDNYGVTISIDDNETLSTLTDKIVALATIHPRDVMLFADENANKKTHVFNLEFGANYAPIDQNNGLVHPNVKVSYELNSDLWNVDVAFGAEVPFAASEEKPTLIQDFTAFKHEGEIKAQLTPTKEFSIEMAGKYERQETFNGLPGATYFGATAGVSWSTPIGFLGETDMISPTFFGQVATGWQATWLDTMGMQIHSIPLLGRLGFNYDRFFKVTIGADALILLTSGLPNTAVYKDLTKNIDLTSLSAELSMDNLLSVFTGKTQEIAEDFRWSIPAKASIDLATGTISESLGFKSIGKTNFTINPSILSNQHINTLLETRPFSLDLGLRFNLGTGSGTTFDIGATVRDVGKTNLLEASASMKIQLGSIE